MTNRTATFLALAMRIATLVAILVLACHLHAFAQAKLDHRLTVYMPDFQLGDVIQALVGMTGAKIIFPSEFDDLDRLVSLHIKDGTVADALDALGLAWETRGDIIVVTGLKASEAAEAERQGEISPEAGLPKGWVIWWGDLPRDVAEKRLTPEAMKVTEDGLRLQGTLVDLLADLKQAGLAISIDPGASANIPEADIDIAWQDDATVEQALLRGLLSALIAGVDLAVIQRRDQDGTLLPTLRIVSAKQAARALPPGTTVIPFGAPRVSYDNYGRRTVTYDRGAGFIELGDGTRMPMDLGSNHVTVRTKDALLSDLVDMLSQAAGVCIALDDNVDPKLSVTTDLAEMPVLAALGALVDQADLAVEVQTNDEGQFQGFLIVHRGKAPQAARTCPEDGTKLQPHWRFCPVCGKLIDGEPEQAPPATAAPDDQPDQ
jgi:hypothetical protein